VASNSVYDRCAGQFGGPHPSPSWWRLTAVVFVQLVARLRELLDGAEPLARQLVA
jgi:hypothetical protein